MEIRSTYGEEEAMSTESYKSYKVLNAIALQIKNKRTPRADFESIRTDRIVLFSGM